MKVGRAPLFLAERLISQAGGLAFTALVARAAPPDQGAAFFTAYAIAAVLQPMLSSAVQPLATRMCRDHGVGGFLPLFILMQVGGFLTIVPMMAALGFGLGAVMLLHALLAPGLLFSAPLVASDRYRALAITLIAASLLGAGLRIAAFLITGDLIYSAFFFAIEPIVGGGVFLSLSKPWKGGTRLAPPSFAEVSLMIAIMGATSLFWRSPILLAAVFLTDRDVIVLTIALQIVMGLCMPANAICQSLLGPIARGEDAALGVGLWVAFTAAAAAPIATALVGPAVMAAIYGPDGAAAAPLALWLSPMAGFAALWRIGHFAAGVSHSTGWLLVARMTALVGQAMLGLTLIMGASILWIAQLTPISMMLSAVVAPLILPGLRTLTRRSAMAAWRAALIAPSRRRALRLLFA